MSQSISKSSETIVSSSNFNTIFEKGLKAYKSKTKQYLTAHPLTSQLQASDSPAAILTILQDQVHQFEQSQSGDERLRRWIKPTVNVLYAFSATLGQGVGLVFPPARVIFAGAGVLLLAAKDVEGSQDVLIDIFERVENFFRRLEVYTNVPPTPAMTEMMVKIIIEVLDILGTATKEMKQSRFKKFLKKVAGITKLDDGLKKLDKMTNEEARMANAESLRIGHVVEKKVEEVNKKVEGVDKKVVGVDKKVEGVDKKVEGIDKKVEGVGTQVKDVDEKVQGVDKDIQFVGEHVIVVKKNVQMVIDDGKEAKLELQQIAYDVNDVKRKQLRERIRTWQSPSDPSINHNIACGLHSKGSAKWFCDGNIFEEWKVTGSLLWIHGKPGSGKSVLCSAIIERIATLYKAGTALMAYFYFDFRDVTKRSRRNLLPSLLVQLSARSDPFCDILSRLYEEHDDGLRQPSDSALMGCLKEMLTLPDQGPIYLILDALDECPKTSGVPYIRNQVLGLVKDLFDLRLPSLHICVTSRPEVDIQDILKSIASHSVSLHDESGQQKDITEYVISVVRSNSVREIRRWRDADKDLVIKTLSERADGMFRWVFCQLETLQHCLPQNVPRALRELPTSLDETYERVLKEIATANRRQAYHLLQCLTVASRPLRVEELAEILALDFDEAKGGIPELKEDWRWRDQQEAVLSTCSSLIAVIDSGRHRVVQFSHFSVKEFLTSDRLVASVAGVSYFHIPPEPAHTVIVKACLGILLQSDQSVGDAKAKNSPLAEYAAEYWVGHAQFGEVSTIVEDGMRRLFDLAKPHFVTWLKLYDIDKPWNTFVPHWITNYTRGSPLYYASLCGFHDLAAHLVEKHPRHLNARVGRNRSSLVAALRNKHFHVAELLYQRGAKLNIRGTNNFTPLLAASVDGSIDIVQWLLIHGGNANLRNDDDETPLHYAVKNGQIELVRMLLRHGIIVNAKNKDKRTPLHLASEQGEGEIAQLLLQHGADVTMQDLNDSTPLHLALVSITSARLLFQHKAHAKEQQHSYYDPAFDEGEANPTAKTVQILLEHGADVTMRDDTHSTPLHLASSNGSLEAARLLIKHGADVNAHDNRHHSTPLHLASSTGRPAIVQLLIEHGADVAARDFIRSTPLHLASSAKSPKIVRVLIKHGSDVNALNWNRMMPLHLALGGISYSGFFQELQPQVHQRTTETVQVLLEHGADVAAQCGTRSTPLHLASLIKSPEIVRLLIKHGADVNALDGKRMMPLHLALVERERSGRPAEKAGDSYLALGRKLRPQMNPPGPEIIRVLLEYGADVTALNGTQSTPLHLALSIRAGPEIVRQLIEHGADINARDRSYSTPLHLASGLASDPWSASSFLDEKENAEMIQVLLEHGADMTSRDDTRSAPLHLASSNASPRLVRLLIEHGADVNARDQSHSTPLHLVSSLAFSPLGVGDDGFFHDVVPTRHRERVSRERIAMAKKDANIFEVLLLLLNYGADVTTRDDTHSTPLHLASLNGSPDSVQLLIDHGADVNAQDRNHNTPLFLALSSWQLKTMWLLTEIGVDSKHLTDIDVPHHSWPHDSEEYLQKYLEQKKSNEKAKIVQVLLEHGAEVTSRDDTHSAPLHLASPKGYRYLDLARLMIPSGE